jgi:hypothetical protein
MSRPNLAAPPLRPGQPAASLREQLRILADWREAQSGPWWQDPARRTVLTAPVCSPALAVWAVVTADPLAWVAFALHAVLTASHAVQWHSDRARDDARRRLQEAVRVEQRTADTLRPLMYEWLIVHDRRLPGSSVRLPHIAVGAAGVVLLIPAGTTGGPYGEECPTSRRPVADQLASALAGELGRTPAPVTAIVVTTGSLPTGGSLPDEVCPLPLLLDRMRALPGILSPTAAGYLGRIVDERCPPMQL